MGGDETPDGRLGARFIVKDNQTNGTPPIEGTVNRRGGTCVVCESTVPFTYIRGEGKAGRMGQQLMAVAAEGQRGRKYLEASVAHVAAAEQARPEWAPESELPTSSRLPSSTIWHDATPRPLHPTPAGRTRDVLGPRGGSAENHSQGRSSKLRVRRGAAAYADAVATYLAFALNRLLMLFSTLCPWSANPAHELVVNMFGRQAIPMVWDFGEINPFSQAASWAKSLQPIPIILDRLPALQESVEVVQRDAVDFQSNLQQSSFLISTDPPYYDNIGYADLSDFFYVWLRRSLGGIYPEIFGTMLVPKAAELVATPFRFGGSKKKAREFFERGLGTAFARMREQANPDYPVTIYYAFKQAESEKSSANGGVAGDDHGILAVASTGWETMLTGLMEAGYQITGTWPMRTERPTGLKATVNALASSVLMVCRPRPENAPVASRRDFQNALRRELPGALSVMIRENIAPVDLAQATIGPGMAIYSRYSSVLRTTARP